MNDETNKKISIDIEINGQQQIQQFNTAFSNLRQAIININTSVTNASKGINELNKNISDLSGGINKFNVIGNSSSSIISKIISAIASAIGMFNGLKTAITAFGVGFEIFEAQATAGISIIISFIPVIVNWVGSLFKADTATKSLNQTLKEHKAALDAVKQARVQGAQDAQEELTQLRLLYNASQSDKLSKQQRLQVIKQLQAQYPDYFGNLLF